jgi:uncharacterized Zn finger protein
MSSFDRQPFELECPSCSREIKTSYYEICSRREAKCRHCGSMYKFDPRDVTYLRMAVQGLEQAQKKVEKALEKAIESAETISK